MKGAAAGESDGINVTFQQLQCKDLLNSIEFNLIYRALYAIKLSLGA